LSCSRRTWVLTRKAQLPGGSGTLMRYVSPSCHLAPLQRLPRAPLPHRTSYLGHASVDKAKGIARERASQDPTRSAGNASVDGGPIRGNGSKPLAAIPATGDFSLVGGFADMGHPRFVFHFTPSSCSAGAATTSRRGMT
jgi:hypothetical protein